MFFFSERIRIPKKCGCNNAECHSPQKAKPPVIVKSNVVAALNQPTKSMGKAEAESNVVSQPVKNLGKVEAGEFFSFFCFALRRNR